MPHQITYYAIVGGGRTIENPYGLVRRLVHDDGPSDEALNRDFCWAHTPIIIEWKHGDFEEELVEVSHQEAEKIIEYFRGRWGESAGA
jgi:hypothetical protein